MAHTKCRRSVFHSLVMALVTSRNINSLPDGEHRVADNLFLLVRKEGASRIYFFRYVSPSGQRRKFSLGSSKTTSLTEARNEADHCRVILAKGLDPKDIRDGERKRLQDEYVRNKADATLAQYLDQALEEIIELRMVRESTAKLYRNTARRVLLPLFGKEKIRSLTSKSIADALRPIWTEKPTQTPVARWLLENILDRAILAGIIEHNPARWKGGLGLYLPAQSKIVKREHFFAIDLDSLRSALPVMMKSGDVGSHPAALIALTACRLQEVLLSTWDDVDDDLRTLTIPPERRKDGRQEPHRVPLSRQAQEILKRMPKTEGFIFKGKRRGNAVSRCAVSMSLRNASGVNEATIHGLRSTFSQWAAENGVDFEVRETCLMHAVGNEVTRAYQRSDLLDRRREVMQQWADAILPMDVLEKALAERK